MVTATEQGRDTRERLMDAAVELIAERGWGAVTTRVVADRARLRPGLVHYHFASVNDLLIDASLRLIRQMGSDLLDHVLQQRGPARVEHLVRTITAYTAADMDTRVVSEMLLAATRHTRLRTELGSLLRGFRSTVTSWLRAADTTDADTTDAGATAAVLLAAFDGLVLHRLIDPGLGELGIAGPLRRLAGLSATARPEEPGDE